jgi:hypothetical protein
MEAAHRRAKLISSKIIYIYTFKSLCMQWQDEEENHQQKKSFFPCIQRNNFCLFLSLLGFNIRNDLTKLQSHSVTQSRFTSLYLINCDVEIKK